MKLTLAAQAQLRRIFHLEALDRSPESEYYFRVGVIGGGCSGFQYEYSLVHNKNEDDIFLAYPQYDLGLCQGLVIDEISFEYLQSAQLDYEKNLHGQRFVVHNERAQSVCGCGRSISF